jgi:y4mF family transcriptional regulator
MRSKGNREVARALGRLARARRKTLGVTQIELARLAGCGPVFIYALESGKPSLRLDKLLDVLAVLGLELVVAEGHGRLRVSAPRAESRP